MSHEGQKHTGPLLHHIKGSLLLYPPWSFGTVITVRFIFSRLRGRNGPMSLLCLHWLKCFWGCCYRPGWTYWHCDILHQFLWGRVCRLKLSAQTTNPGLLQHSGRFIRPSRRPVYVGAESWQEISPPPPPPHCRTVVLKVVCSALPGGPWRAC